MVRFKSRYLLFEIIYNDSNIHEQIQPTHLLSAIKESIQQNFGDAGTGSILSNLSMKYYSPFTNLGILRCGREHVKMVWASMGFVTEVKGRKCMFRIVHNAGEYFFTVS
jgi:ribonuclease P/MRP protein subunit POP5